jgi:hypothetical protein
LNLSVLTDFVKFIDCHPVEQRFVAEVFNMMLIDIPQPEWVGSALAFLALLQALLSVGVLCALFRNKTGC